MNIAVIQARLGSTRFPAKVLALLAGKPIIQHVIERAKQIKGIDLVLVAIPSGDFALERVVRDLGVFPVLGPEDDVLSRFKEAVNGRPCTAIMRITADCPVFDVETAGLVLKAFLDGDVDYASNDTTCSGYPDGWDIEVFSPAALDKADRQTHGDDRQHVTPWMRQHLTNLTVEAPGYPGSGTWTGPKLSVDTPDDLVAVERYLTTIPPTPKRKPKS